MPVCTLQTVPVALTSSVSVFVFLALNQIGSARTSKVYLSAGHILKRDFAGKRLDAVTKRNPPAMTNLWPYLRARQEERSSRLKAYEASFLSTALEGRLAPIHRRLWGSPDHEKQAAIAVRFVSVVARR